MPRICLLLLFSYALNLTAQSFLRDGKDYAIFFYCTDFKENWTPLPETKGEVNTLADILESDYGFITEFISNPSKTKIKEAIAEWNARVQPNDQILYFFSTHGYYDKETNEGYLIPYNGKLQDTYGDSWISYEDLGRRVTKSNSKHVLLALDACYSGAFGDRYKGVPDNLPWEEADDCATQIKNALAYRTRRYFTSGSKQQRTPARSLFARAWLTALRQGQERGIVRVRDLRYHLGNVNTPQPEDGSFTGHMDGDFVFVHREACEGMTSSYSTSQAEEQLWQQATRLNTKEAYIFYLQAYPNGKHKKLAERKILGGQKPILHDLIEMVFVEGGTFQMGREDGDDSEKPVHSVTLDDFYMHRYEVTNAEFAAFLNAEGNQKIGGTEWYEISSSAAKIENRSGRYYPKSGYERHPVIEVNWYGAVAYCNWRSKADEFTPVYTINDTNVNANWNANGYRLPTEAEWEFAARSRGSTDKWAGTSSEASLASYANFCDENCTKSQKTEEQNDGYERTAPVGSFHANGLGLHDMNGNVYEWCWDWYSIDYYKNSPSRNPRGPGSGSFRVPRGGSWLSTPANLHCTDRVRFSPNDLGSGLGFRLCRTAP
ncbi:MAG: SUMF1/EgtB/PvdO family nonheme iron enzyme [Chitinophagales bacterium]|nr:SUMF1/EgtB/PvdO family nonheme iron enzyme [Chitinophagales bacterium]